jgi:hypothetical protein
MHTVEQPQRQQPTAIAGLAKKLHDFGEAAGAEYSLTHLWFTLGTVHPVRVSRHVHPELFRLQPA